MPHFGGRLEAFLEYTATVYDGLPAADRATVRGKCAALLADVDFGAARDSAIVACTPGGPAGKGNKGGWQQLRQSLGEIGAPALGGDGRVDVATGHFGALQRDFLGQMCRTLRRDVRPPADSAADDAADGGGWDDVGRVFLYHSSRRTALREGTNCLACFRTTAPSFGSDRHVLDTLFHDFSQWFTPSSQWFTPSSQWFTP